MKVAAAGGSSQRVPMVKFVGFAGQENRWVVVWVVSMHLGHLSLGYLVGLILFRYEFR